MAMGIFLSVIMVLVIFNIGYYAIYPDTIQLLGVSIILSFATAGLIIGVISGVEVLGSGISDTAQRIIFIVVILLNMLFQIDIPIGEGITIPVGLGLLSNVLEVFVTNDAYLVGYAICTILGVLALVSGLQMAVGAGDG